MYLKEYSEPRVKFYDVESDCIVTVTSNGVNMLNCR